MYHATVGVYVFGTPHYGSAFASFIVPVAQAIRPFHFVNLRILKDLLPDKIRPRHRRENAGEGDKKEESTWQRELVDLLLRRKADNDPIRFFCGFEQLGRAGIPGLHRVSFSSGFPDQPFLPKFGGDCCGYSYPLHL